MGISVAGQTIDFLLACLFGMALGAFYDVFRIIRVAVRCGKAAIFIQDAVFWLLCALSTFMFLLIESSGQVRFFMIFGELIGATVYYLTLGRAVMKCAAAIISAIKTALRFLHKIFGIIFVKPINKLTGALKPKIKKSGDRAEAYCKKQGKVLKLRLQHARKVLYNQRQSDNKAAKKKKTKRKSGKKRE